MAFRQCGGVALALELPLRAGAQRRVHLLLGSAARDSASSLGGAKAVRKASATTASSAAQMYWQAGKPSLGAQMVTYILPAALIADVHLVTAPRAPGDAVQQKIAVAGCAPRLVAHVFRPIVSYDAADHFVGRPVTDGPVQPPVVHLL